MPGSTLVGVFVTTTHRISAVESEFRAGPALARDFGASLEVQTEPWRSSRDVGSGAVKPSFGLLITRAAAVTRAISHRSVLANREQSRIEPPIE